ncbi:acyl transferase/acyl hydrolase/lysophospholipase [Mycena olivaceomarginata]|nr:acyl transferase/acyl hydrolase/lysophospholipase [Mycena olivaceomarginata]
MVNPPETEGLRLLSLDGGGIRGLSMLLILEHLMYKLKVTEGLPDIPHPCDYFDLIGGTSTGGLIALMLGRLQMSVEDSKKAYGQLAKEVFSDVKFQGSAGKFKASKLEKAIKQIAETYSESRNPEERLEDIRDNACKIKIRFVCAMNAANMSLPVLFRTYNTLDHPAMNCTIWEAGRATSAAPAFFKQIKIGLSGIEEAFVDGGLGHNNPTASLLSEAKHLFPDHQIACIISLGTGQPHTISIPKPSPLNRFLPFDVVKAIQEMATDCEKEHQAFAHRFNGIANFYFRFNVEQGMQNIQLNQWERLGDVAANTRQYIQSQLVTNQLADAARSLSEKIGKVFARSLAPVPTAFEIGESQVVPTLVGCPLPSQIFQGRQDILTRMKDYFSKDIGKRHVYVLYGLGGSGKTQIALKFLDMMNQCPTPWYLNQNIMFTRQFFINASSQQTLDTAFKNIAIANKSGNSPQDTLLWLSSQIEECTHGNIIITSRNPQLVAYGAMSHSKVGDMDEANAIDLLLLRAAKEKTPETAAKASEIVKDHARLLKEHPKQSHDDYKWTVFTTWEISFKQLSPVAAQFLQMCSLLHHYSIPEAIFEKAAGWTSDNSGDAQNLHQARVFLQNFWSPWAIWNQQSFMDIIAEITAYSLVDRHSGGYTFDSSTGRYQEAEPLEVTVLDRQKQLFGANHPDTLTAMANLATTYHQLGRYQEAEPLGVTVLDKRKQLFGANHPSTLDAMANLAATYRQLGRYQEAEPLEVTVLDKRKQLFGANHPDTLSAMANLAATYHQLGRYQEAEPLGVTVLDKRKQLFDANHPSTLYAMANLAATYRQLGRYQEAEPLEVTVLDKRKQLFGANHPDTLTAMAHLAATYRQLGRYQEAEPLGVTVLDKRKQLFGANHPSTLSAMAHLAATYRQLGRYQEAEPLGVTVLDKRKQLFGANHPDTLSAMAHLAATYRQLGRYQEAEPLGVTVLDKRKQLFGANHPDTLSAMAHLAATYRQLGRYQEAEPLGVTVLDKRKQLFGANHPDTLSAMAHLAATYRQLGRYQEAEPLGPMLNTTAGDLSHSNVN